MIFFRRSRIDLGLGFWEVGRYFLEERMWWGFLFIGNFSILAFFFIFKVGFGFEKSVIFELLVFLFF